MFIKDKDSYPILQNYFVRSLVTCVHYVNTVPLANVSSQCMPCDLPAAWDRIYRFVPSLACLHIPFKRSYLPRHPDVGRILLNVVPKQNSG